MADHLGSVQKWFNLNRNKSESHGKSFIVNTLNLCFFVTVSISRIIQNFIYILLILLISWNTLIFKCETNIEFLIYSQIVHDLLLLYLPGFSGFLHQWSWGKLILICFFFNTFFSGFGLIEMLNSENELIIICSFSIL